MGCQVGWITANWAESVISHNVCALKKTGIANIFKVSFDLFNTIDPTKQLGAPECQQYLG